MSSNSNSPGGKGKGTSVSGGFSSRFSKFTSVVNRSFHRSSKSKGDNTLLSPPKPPPGAASTSSINSSVSQPAQSSNVTASGQVTGPLAPAYTQSKSQPVAPLPAVAAPPYATPTNYSDKLWGDALKSLSDGDQKILSLGEIDKIGILTDALAAARKAKDFYAGKQWTFEWKGEQVKIRDVVEKILSCVEKFKMIGDIIVQYDPGHSALPWAAFRFLLVVALDDSQKMGALLAGLEKVANLIDRCKIYETLYLGHDLEAGKGLEKELTVLYASLLRYLASARRAYNKNTAVRILVSVVDTEGVTLFQEIEKNESIVFKETQLAEAEYQRSFHKNSQLANAEGLQKLRDLLEDLSQPITRIESKVDTVLDNLQDEIRNQILMWLSKVPYTKHHDTAREGRTERTGEWLLREEQFSHWQDSSESSILWLHGIPGAGKTKLTSMVVDNFLEKQRECETEEALAYFYCNRDESQRRDPEVIMAALLKQLSRLRPELPLKEPIVAEYQKIVQRDGSLSGSLGLHRCTELIHQLLEFYPQTTIIIDALDECDEEKRGYLLSALENLIKESRSRVKIFVSSRDDRDIVHRLEKVPNLYISANDSMGDIEIYVKDEVAKCIKDRKLLKGKVNEELKQHICKVLAEGAHGMFLWVALQIKSICKLKIPEDIEEKLGKLPKSLTETYSEIYGAIVNEEGSGSELAKRALMWLMCCQRPLSPEEWAAAASFEPASGRKYTVDADDLLDLCHNLVVLDRQLNVIRFAHLSIEEFLDEYHQDSFNIIDRNIMAAECCIYSLCNPVSFATGGSSSQYQSSFLAYSNIHWPTHVNIQYFHSIDRQKLKRLGGFLEDFLGSFARPSPAYLGWLQNSQSTLRAMDSSEWQKIALYEDFQHLVSDPPSALPVASLYGLGEIIEALWDSDSFNINSQNTNNESILYLASITGHQWIVKKLLSKGADISAQGGYYDNALRAAAENGNDDVVKILLDGGAEVNAQGGFYGNVLQAAAMSGHEGVVKVLLDGGADVHAKGGYHGNALQAAAETGHVGVAETLLDGGADINAQGGFFGNALQAASVNGHEELVYLLLDRGAEVNSQGGFYGSALQAAVCYGSQTIVKALLDEGANVNSPVGFFGCALQMAALAGRKDLFEILLERGADVNFGGGFYGNPLQAAAKNGHGGLVGELLNKGAQMDSQPGSMCWNALNAAAEGGYLKLVRVLLSNGANVNEQGGFYGNALQAAARWGHLEVVKILIDRGADINAQGGSYKNALSAAAIYGHPSVVEILLDSGADPNSFAGRLSRQFSPDTMNIVRELLRGKGVRVEDY